MAVLQLSHKITPLEEVIPELSLEDKKLAQKGNGRITSRKDAGNDTEVRNSLQLKSAVATTVLQHP